MTQTQRMFADARMAKIEADRLHSLAVEYQRKHPPQKCNMCGGKMRLVRRFADGGWFRKCDACGSSLFIGFIACNHGPETTCTMCPAVRDGRL